VFVQGCVFASKVFSFRGSARQSLGRNWDCLVAQEKKKNLRWHHSEVLFRKVPRVNGMFDLFVRKQMPNTYCILSLLLTYNCL
jgi:hypothetical protein